MIRLALIGAGRWGQNIQRTLKAIPGCQLTSVSNSATETKRILREPNLNGVLIATPGSTHARIALPFIKKGLPAFIEKPLTTSLKDALALQQIAKKSKAIVMVGHLHRYNPAYRAFKTHLRTVGKLQVIMGESMSDGPIRKDMSVLWDWGPHDVSLVLDLMQKLPKSVQAWGNYHHTAMKLNYTIPVFITVSWLSPEKRKKLIIQGQRGKAVFDDRAECKLSLQSGLKTYYPRYGEESPLEAELRAFIEAIQTKKQPLTDIKNGIEVVRVLAAAEKSMKLDGRKVSV